jgi:hypothetical protein
MSDSTQKRALRAEAAIAAVLAEDGDQLWDSDIRALEQAKDAVSRVAHR